VLTFAISPERGAIVWYFSGKENSDDDYARYVASFAEADALGAKHAKPVGLLYVEPNNPLPNAAWRKRMAEASTSLRSKPVLAFCSQSPLVRGIVTAVNWLRPPPYEFNTVSTFEEGLAWLEARRGESLPILGVLLGECKRTAGALPKP
jgi:hypothetical protein